MLQLDYKKYFANHQVKAGDTFATRGGYDVKAKISNSTINTYALSLYTKDFCKLDDKTLQMFEDLKKGRVPKQYKAIMQALCEKCGEFADSFMINTARLRAYISDCDKQEKNRNIKNKLSKLNDQFLLLWLERNLSSETQAINDKNCYILAPNAYLEAQVGHVKNFNIQEIEKFNLLHDCAFIVIKLTNADFLWDKRDKKFLQELENAVSREQKPIEIEPMMMSYFAQGDLHKRQKLEYFLPRIYCIIVENDSIKVMNNDYQSLDITWLGMAVFELEIFKSPWISFELDEKLVIFSSKILRSRYDSDIYQKICDIKDDRIRPRKTWVLERLNMLCNDRLLDLRYIYYYLEDCNVFVKREFLNELKKIKDNLSYKNFSKYQTYETRKWLINDISHLYAHMHGYLKYKSGDELAQIYFEQLLGRNIKEFIKCYKPLFLKESSFEEIKFDDI
ncbi:hypothetical protein [Campylobacter sputorum]|uniref:hypothetical protein n=1 Tax=Campylobacter sputorum TaxID=206 RepID=UPI000B77F5B5|nr:hypothetical protein [Campylobacter sputorum]ASM37021.1 hypothetical protein CSF_1158 [Campylobacter sputorum bv. faecalis CCUG 20703]